MQRHTPRHARYATRHACVAVHAPGTRSYAVRWSIHCAHSRIVCACEGARKPHGRIENLCQAKRTHLCTLQEVEAIAGRFQARQIPMLLVFSNKQIIKVLALLRCVF